MSIRSLVQTRDLVALRELANQCPSLIDECDEEGLTALEHAIETRDIEAARVLLECGADPNLGKDKYVPLLRAIDNEVELAQSKFEFKGEPFRPRPEFSQLLLFHGASAASTTSIGESVSEYARRVGHLSAALLIESAGTDKV